MINWIRSKAIQKAIEKLQSSENSSVEDIRLGEDIVTKIISNDDDYKKNNNEIDKISQKVWVVGQDIYPQSSLLTRNLTK